MTQKEENRVWRGLMLTSIGLIVIFTLTRALEAELAWAAFTLGFSFTGFGLAEISISLWRMEKKRLRIANWHRRRMQQANRGVVWIWVVCLAGICVYALAFYVLVYPALEVIGIVEGLTDFDPNATYTLNFVRTVLNWHPIIFIVGLLLWAYVNSQRKEDITYPAY